MDRRNTTGYRESMFAPPVPKVAFRTSIKSREMLPLKIPYNRLGNQVGLNPRGNTNIGPGYSEIEKMTNLFRQMCNHIDSSKGYSLGARTATIQMPKPKFQTPAPTEYQKCFHNPKIMKASKKPFLVASPRFPMRKNEMFEATPGPGTYRPEMGTNCQVLHPQSFGGTPVHMPNACQQSTIPINTAKLKTFSDEQTYFRKLAYFKLYFD